MTRDNADRIPQCAATTAAGHRCRKLALPGTSRCAHHSFRVPGRPTRLTPDLQARVLDAVLAGNYLETAANAVGIDRAVLYRWLRRADDLTAKAEEHAPTDTEYVDVYAATDPAEWIYLDFRHALKAAEAVSELGLLERVRGGGDGWQAFMTILERRHPTRWGRRAVLDHTIKGELEQRTRVELIAPLEDERRRAVAELLERAGALTPDADAEP